MAPIPVLDVAPVGFRSTAEQPLGTTATLARRADELGYARFWVA